MLGFLMREFVMFRFVVALASVLWASEATARSWTQDAPAQQSCKEIRFAPGASSGVVSGMIAARESVCYRFGSGAGQTARLKLVTGPYACFNVDEIVECQGEATFTTQARSYKITVFTFDSRRAYGPYSLELSIR